MSLRDTTDDENRKRKFGDTPIPVRGAPLHPDAVMRVYSDYRRGVSLFPVATLEAE